MCHELEYLIEKGKDRNSCPCQHHTMKMYKGAEVKVVIYLTLPLAVGT
jgi:hypothetical protein